MRKWVRRLVWVLGYSSIWFVLSGLLALDIRMSALIFLWFAFLLGKHELVHYFACRGFGLTPTLKLAVWGARVSYVYDDEILVKWKVLLIGMAPYPLDFLLAFIMILYPDPVIQWLGWATVFANIFNLPADVIGSLRPWDRKLLLL